STSKSGQMTPARCRSILTAAVWPSSKSEEAEAKEHTHVATRMERPETRMGRHLHARDPDPLGAAESRIRMDVRGAAPVRVSRVGDVVLSALPFRARSAVDAVHLERLSAVADVPARYRSRDL